jgi:hypothetical protein
MLKRCDRIGKLTELPTSIGNATESRGSLAKRQMGFCYDELNAVLPEFGYVIAQLFGGRDVDIWDRPRIDNDLPDRRRLVSYEPFDCDSQPGRRFAELPVTCARLSKVALLEM